MSNLSIELDEAIERRRRSARRNYIAAYGLYVLALVASIVSTVLVSLEYGSTQLRALLTALPAIALLTNNTLKFEERNQWHRRKRHYLEALKRRLQYSGAPEKEVAEEWTELNKRMALDFPSFGPMPGSTAKSREP